MRVRHLAVTLVLACALVGGVSAGAGAQSSTQWIHFYVHMNAYEHWGVGCTATWDASSGDCHGSMEEGHFLSHHFGHSTPVSWYWNTHGGLKMGGDGWYMSGLKPTNWFTFTVYDAIIDKVEYVSGTDKALAGHPGGPLYVDLTSKRFHSGITLRQGQVLDLQGYLKLK